MLVGLVVLAGAALLLAQDANDAAATPERAIEAGRQALRGRTYYPWYDPATDGVRRVAVTPPQPPPQPRNPNWNWPEWKGWNTSWDWGQIFWTFLQVVVGGLVVALIVWLVFLLMRVFLGRESAAAVASDETQHIETGVADRIEQLPFEIRRPQGDLLAEAARLYERGEYSQAVVYYFSYLLVELDRRQAIRLARGKTNRQYLREVRRERQEVAGLVERTMVAFEDVFFGNHPLDRARFEACWNERDVFQKPSQPSS